MAGTLTPAIFRGCTGGANGTTGIVPAPVAGQNNAFLRGDGLWASPALNGFVAGPGLSVDGTICVFAGVAGNVIRDTGVSIDLTNNLTGVANFICTTATIGAFSGLLYGNAGVVGARTLTGTAGTITVTNGTGVAGNPTITIDATYVGQASITTLGTIGTGVWQGTAVAIGFGGTGQTTKTTGFDALSPLTTRGDLIVFDGTHNIRVGVGTDGQVLQANSGAASGVSWITNPAGAYDTVANAGVNLTQRQVLNFSGSGITAVDNAGATRTDVSLAGTLIDVAGLTPSSFSVIAGNGSNFVDKVPTDKNTYYVDKNGNDATGNGSKLFPYLTVGAACTAIGNAADAAEFNDTTKRYYNIDIGPGIYVENVTVPSRPDVIFDMHGSVIQGTFAQDLDRTLLTGALNTAKVSVIGYDMRGAHSGLSLPKIGIDGAITMGSSVGANNFTSLYLINTGVTGNVLFSGVNPGYQGFLFTQNTNISGSINTSGTGVNINCYLNQAATSGTAGIGGCNGFVNLSAINNINFNGPVITNSNAAGRLWNTVFKAGQAHNFTGSTAALGMDANTYDSYFNNVPTKGGETITWIDTARGINASYAPSNYTAATADVRANLVGIDTAIGTKAAKGANSDITSLSGLTTPLSTAQGGTGVASPTAHGIMVAEGAAAMTSKVLTNGQLLVGSTGADPVAANITSTGSTLAVTNGAGSINIDLNIPLTVPNGGTGATTFTSHGILLGNSTSLITSTAALTNGQLLIGNTGNAPSVATLTQGAGITITNGAGTITIASSAAGSGGWNWVNQVSTPATLVTGSAYANNFGPGVVYNLPAAAAIGDSFKIVGSAAGGWTIAQGAGQQINFQQQNTTSGAGGSLSSNTRFDCITLVCVTANTTFVVDTCVGNITFV